MKTEILTLCDDLAGGALNGVYQGMIIAAVVALVLRLLRRTNAATRHAVWFITLLLLAALIPAHWLRDHSQPLSSREATVASRTPVQATVSRLSQPNRRLIFAAPPGYYDAFIADLESGFLMPAESGKPAEPIEESQGSTERSALGSLPVFPSRDQSEGEPTSEPPRASPLGDQLETQVAPFIATETTLDKKPAVPLKRFIDPISWNLASGWHLPRQASLVLLAVWLGGVSLRLMLFLRHLYQIRKLKTQASPASRVLHDLFEDLRQRLGVARGVRLGISDVYRSPVVLGFVHPVVLLPAEVEEDLHQAKQILRHELAHVRRGDDWANLVQHGIGAALFFHPAVWWVSKQLSLEREIACDDHVLQEGRPRAYALLLADLASRMKSGSPMLAPGVSNSKSQLEKRINMILDKYRDTSPRLAKTRLGFVTTAAALLAVLAIYSAPRLVLAQSHPAQPAPKAPQPAAISVAGPTAGLALGPVPRPPRAPDPDLADGDRQDTPAPPGVEPGPKYKTGPGQAPPPMVLVAPALPPAPPDSALPPTPNPYIVLGQPLAATPRPRSPDAPAGDSSIEERLDRLERMVESLMAQRNHNFVWRNNGFPSAAPGPKDLARLDELTQEQAEIARRQADEASAQAKRAAEEAKRATKQAEKEWKVQAEDMHNKAFGMQLEELKRARESLQREIQRMDRQIQRLEQERQRMEHNHGRQDQGELKDGEQPLSPDGQQLLSETREEPTASEDAVPEEQAKP